MAQHARPHWYTQREYALAPRVEQPEGEDGDEDRHLDETEGAVGLEPGGPREDEHGLHVEHDEEQGEDVVADLALGPPAADGVDAALIRDVFLRLRAAGTDETPDTEHGDHHHDRSTAEHGDREVAAQVVGHVGGA